MAQHDYNLSNNTGALFRADNNAALQAIVTQNSGATAPTVTFPGMLWLDLAGGGDGVMRRRNQANTAWLTDIGQDQVARDAAAAAQATANAAMPKAGGTFTGPINLPGTVPTNNQAVSRAQADLIYQAMLPTPVAGSLLYGTAGGWDAQLPPAANDTVLVVSGGLPTWATGAVTAQPNSYVRTRSDGTLDPTLIPSVASGLRFRGTFRPAVNAEYPTTGGSGTGGVPAVGDFWVIDGLTTGGYTYLTGSLAGVTVYNGDSIAKSDGANWYRMGSSVELEGYMRVDGSTAMTGNLNLGANQLIEVGGIAARAGTPVPLNNFSIDATNIVVSPQRGTTGADLPAMVAGRLGTDLGRMQLFVGAGASNIGLIPVRFFSSTATYAAGDYVVNAGVQYRAPAAVSAGAFVASQWARVLDDRGSVAGLPLNGNFKFTGTNWLGFDQANGNLGWYLTRSADEWGLAVCDTAGAFVRMALTFSGSATNLTRVRSALQCDGFASLLDQTWIGRPNNTRFRFSDFGGGYTSLDAVTSDNAQFSQMKMRAWGYAITCHGGNFQIGSGNIETDKTINGNAGGDGTVPAFVIGNDCQIWDVNEGNACGIYGAQNPNEVLIWLGNIRRCGIASRNNALQLLNNGYTAIKPAGYAAHYLCHETNHCANYKMAGVNSYYWRKSASGYPEAGEVGLMELTDAGALFVAGAVTAANIPPCDIRLKSNIQDATPRKLDGLQWHSFDIIGGAKNQRGIIAQEVLQRAPEHVVSYGMKDEASGESVERFTVNYGSLALEVALNLVDRVAALEAAASPPEPQQEF